MQTRYPFKFLDAYTREDGDFYFGRDDEVDLLYQMVFQTNLLLVYGASGTGKTSLIQCGLACKFQSHDWFSLFVRRGNNINQSLEKALKDAGGTTDEGLEWLNQDWGDTNNPQLTASKSPLGNLIRNTFLKRFRPIYLIFDQFEELFILGTREEQSIFYQTVSEILQLEQPVKIIISIREEYLGYLSDFEKKVPGLFRKKIRVEPMTLDKVKTVITEVGKKKESNVSIATGEEDALAEQIFNKMKTSEHKIDIELPYLQVFLDRFYMKVTGDHTHQKEALFSLTALDEMGDIGDVLRDLLDEQVAKIAADQRKEIDFVWKLLSPFVTLDGTKEPLSVEALEKRLPKTGRETITNILQQLVDNRILRFINDENMYEICHDSLAKQIHSRWSDDEIALMEVQRLVKNQASAGEGTRECFSPRQLQVIERYMDDLTLLPAEAELIEISRQKQKEEENRTQEELAMKRKQLRNTRIISIAAVFGFLISIAGGVVALNQYIKSREESISKEIALNRAHKLEKGYYFFMEKFALAYGSLGDDGENVFYFMDKNGDKVEKLDRWARAEMFDKMGYARVSTLKNRPYTWYLLDTIGNTYKFTRDVLKMDSTIQALDISISDKKTLLNITNFSQLKILHLQSTNALQIPPEIDKLTNLISLSLRGAFTHIPLETGNLINLTSLSLSETGISNISHEISNLVNLRYLDLSNTTLTQLPTEINRLSNLIHLNIMSTKISKLPEINNLSKLEFLYLNNNSIEALPDISNLTNLKHLNIGNTNIKKRLEIGNLSKLNYLNVSNTKIEKVSDIGNLTQLEYLNLSNSPIDSIHGINKLTKLKYFNIEKTKIEKVPDINNLTQLEYLNLSNCPISLLGISKLSKLKFLNIGNTKIKKVLEIGDLKQLEYINLSSDSIESLPDINKLTNLKYLNIENTKIRKLPEISELTQLEYLNLSNCSIDSLPDISKLTKLTYLNIGKIPINHIPQEIGTLTNLIYLNLDSIPINVFPAIGNLTKLEYLNVRKTSLDHLPPEINNLINLKTLNISEIQITDIGNLTNLKWLIIQGDKMTELPLEFNNLTNLEGLDLRYTQITELPAEIGKFTNLQTLYLPKTLQRLPPEISQLTNLKHIYLPKSIKLPPEIEKLPGIVINRM